MILAIALAATLASCEDLAALAGRVMQYRQIPGDAAALIREVGPEIEPFVLVAYNEPLYSTPENKHQAVIEFKNLVYTTRKAQRRAKPA